MPETLATRRDREARQHPRLRINTPVELRSGVLMALGTSENLSLGGMLVSCPLSFNPQSGLLLRFNLPSGHSIHTRAAIVHHQPNGRLGIRFEALDAAGHAALGDLLESIAGDDRRSPRIARRYHVTIRRCDHEAAEEMAETILVNPAGGLLVCRARFKVAERIFLWWPERKRGATAQVVFRRLGGVAGMVELGFSFENADNFWDLKSGALLH